MSAPCLQKAQGDRYKPGQNICEVDHGTFVWSDICEVGHLYAAIFVWSDICMVRHLYAETFVCRDICMLDSCMLDMCILDIVLLKK